MQKIIDAEKSDIFDVLAHVAYALPPVTREVQAANARTDISAHFGSKQQAFLGFVLAHYVSVGVGERDQEKLAPLLRLRYNDSIADASADLGTLRTSGCFLQTSKSITTSGQLRHSIYNGAAVMTGIQHVPEMRRV